MDESSFESKNTILFTATFFSWLTLNLGKYITHESIYCLCALIGVLEIAFLFFRISSDVGAKPDSHQRWSDTADVT